MEDNEKPKSVFYGLMNMLRGKKNPAESLPNGRDVISGSSPVKNQDPNNIQQKQQQYLDFQSTQIAKDIYSRTQYFETDRISAYNDYNAMDKSPEVAAALDIISSECCQRNERGNIIGIYSDNLRIKKILEELFKKTLNVESNISFWARELCKNGDVILRLDVDQKEGIYDCVLLPLEQVHKEMGFDGNPQSSRYKWDMTTTTYLEDFQVAHFRLLYDASRLPYGRSILDPARKLWRQLQLAEDAMLTYRIIRAPERRIFYIQMGNTDPNDYPQLMEQVKRSIKKTSIVDSTGQINLKFNPLPVWSKTPIPLLDNRIITIEELAKEFEEGKENYVFSVQDKTNKIVPGKVVWCGKNYTANSLIKTWLDDNTWILTAPEHPFVLRDGSSKRADELMSGDSLMPYYVQENVLFKGAHKHTYTEIYNPNNEKYEFVHRLVASEITKNKEEYNTIHHVDFNRYNNNPKNLEWVDFHEHKLMHSENQKNKWKNPEYRKNHSIKVKSKLKFLWENGHMENNRIASRQNMVTWNKSEEKIKRVSVKNIERNSVEKMAWYNNSELHTSHNEIRSKNKKAFWDNKENNLKAKQKMTIKTNENCFRLLCEFISNKKTYINSTDLMLELKNTEFLNELQLANKGSKRDLNKYFHRHNLAILLKNNNIQNYSELLLKYNPELFELQKQNKANNLRKESRTPVYQNHKVLKTEVINSDSGEDVYCMTVVGLNDEHDRHNFACLSFNEDDSISKSGVFVKNTYEEDFFLPLVGDKSSKIDTLPGANNLNDIADITYLQDKLFAALQVPKPYLNYAESIAGGSTLSQIDVRFGKMICRIQEQMINEFRRIANIHLYTLGFEDDLDNFVISLTNPSIQQELMNLELWKAKLEVFKELYSSEVTSPVSYSFAMERVLGLSKSEIKQILVQKKVERKMFSEIERAVDEYMDTGIFKDVDSKFRRTGFDPAKPITDGGGDEGGGGGFGGSSMLGGGGADMSGGDSGMGDDLGGDVGGDVGGDLSGGVDNSMPTDMSAEPSAETEPALDEPSDEEEIPNLKENKLLTENRKFNIQTRKLMKNINESLAKLKKQTKEEDDDEIELEE